jgi:hypothetical protein
MGASGLQKEFLRVEALKGHPLFPLLKADVAAGQVFPAIRNGELQFYFAGGRLARFGGGGLSTNERYLVDDSASVESRDVSMIRRLRGKSWEATYSFMKEACHRRWRTSEGDGEQAITAKTFHSWSIAQTETAKSAPLLLDVEIRFPAGGNGPENQDKVDILLIDPNSVLFFIEVKRRKDPRARAQEGREPKVVGQLRRYGQHLQRQEVQADIVDVYRTYMATLESVFDLRLRRPTRVFPMAPLLIVDDVAEAPLVHQEREHWQRTALARASQWSPEDEMIVIDGRMDPALAVQVFVNEASRRTMLIDTPQQ